jgi:hypothetical protein
MEENLSLPEFDQRVSGQREPEYLIWISLCMAMGVRSYVELGSGSGHFLLKAGVPKVVSIDITHSTERHNPYESEGVHYLRGDSHDLETLYNTLLILDNDRPDAVFIDAAHDYDSVRHDFDMWWPAAKMLVGFHDILIPDVARLWNKVSLGVSSAKIIGCDVSSAKSWQGPSCPDDGVLSAGGIGVLFK